MTSRERITHILERNETIDRPGFWMGNPNETSVAGICSHFGKQELEEVRRLLKDELFWVPADSAYARTATGWTVFDGWEGKCKECRTEKDLDALDWPDPQQADFGPIVNTLTECGDRFRLGGMWAPFFHDISAFMGMEEYFISMYERPQFIHALTQRLIDFYCEANRKFFAEVGDELDAYFFGNDLGSQISTLVSPGMFDEFLRPYMSQLIEVATSFGLKVVLHSCGSISALLPQFIAMGVDAIHPVQTKAAWMDTATLKRFKDQIAFIGGIDTQQVLPFGSPDDVRSAVRDTIEAMSVQGGYVLAPSQSFLPDIPVENIVAMYEEGIAIRDRLH
jgi:uroporphyrinogen decarboxylase